MVPAQQAEFTVSAEPGPDRAGSRLGQRTPRPEGPAKVSGRTRFTGDLVLPRLLHARLVLSPEAHGTIDEIDRAEAEAQPGVVRVLLAADLDLAQAGSGVRKRDPLARDRVLYNGHPVAVVVATSEAAAQDGANLVMVNTTPMAAVVDHRTALAAAPVLPAGNKVDDEEAALHGGVSGGESSETAPANQSSHLHLGRGDVAAGFASADQIVRQTSSTSWIHQGYLEPQAAVAEWDSDDHVRVWASTQALFHTRAEVAATVGLRPHQVTIVPMPVGGGFGGKFGLLEPLAAAVARAVGQPVRLAYSRMDEFLNGNPAGASTIDLQLGGTRDGTLTALAAELTFDTGAAPSSAGRIAPTLLGGQYAIPNLDISATEVFTHKAGGGSYRAPGAVAAHFAVESAIDDLAHALGLDPLAIRLRNCAVEGDLRPTNAPWPRIGLRECLEQIGDHPLWRDRAILGGGAEDHHGRRQGVGLAVGGWPGGIEPATAVCRLEDDGSIAVVVGAVDLSGTHNGFRTIVAEELGIDPNQVRVIINDSDTAPRSGSTGGSKITLTVGKAVQAAAADAKMQILAIAANQLEAAAEDLEIVEGRVQVRGVPGFGMTLADAARLSTSPGSPHEPVYGRGASAINRNSPGFGAHLAHVAVDPATHQVHMVHYVVAQDVGRALNRAEVEGQIHGGVVQGLGYALWEQMAHSDDGQVLTGTFLDYAMPRAAWIPPIEVHLVEVPSLDGPFGAKGVGEPPIIPVAAAVANAIRDAIGLRLTHLPITPQRIFDQIRAGTAA